MSEIQKCSCKWPMAGPLYWNWRCMTCAGQIVGWLERRRLRRAATPSPLTNEGDE